TQAAEQDNTETALLLLDRGACVNVSCRYRAETPLLRAARNDNLILAKALLRHGARVNIPGDSALMWAVDSGNFDAARLLLKRRAVVNTSVREGMTPLMRTVEWGEE